MSSNVTHKPLEPFGIEVTLDSPGDLSAADREELRRLYAMDGLIVIRDQRLNMEQQRELSEIFGPVLTNSIENIYVSNVREGGILGTTAIPFHNDVTYLPAPYQAASLHAVEVEEDSAATRFVSGARAYERLPGALRDRIEKLNSLHVRSHASDRRTRLSELEPGDICAVHAVVGRQPATGRPYLFISPMATECVIGLSEGDSETLLQELFSYFHAEDQIYNHVWKRGDIVIWDNLILQHARGDASRTRRTLQRVTITELGYEAQYPTDARKILQDKSSLNPAMQAQ